MRSSCSRVEFAMTEACKQLAGKQVGRQAGKQESIGTLVLHLSNSVPVSIGSD